MEKNLKLSVVICTYNRSDLLRIALDSLTKQSVNTSEFETIVVDNNSTDNTLEVCNSFSTLLPGIKYIQEKTQGLSYARNRGYKEAQTGYIAYLDDDAKANEDWILQAFRIIDNLNPDIFGGPIHPYYLSEKPVWFMDDLEIRVHTEKTGILPLGSYISGSNFIVKKSLLEKINGFDTKLGMVGNNLAYGEETDLINKSRLLNAFIYYDHDLIVQHFVPPYKMSIFYYLFFEYRTSKILFEIENRRVDSNLGDLYKNLVSELKTIELIIQKGIDENKQVQKLNMDYTLLTAILPRVSKLAYRIREIELVMIQEEPKKLSKRIYNKVKKWLKLV